MVRVCIQFCQHSIAMTHVDDNLNKTANRHEKAKDSAHIYDICKVFVFAPLEQQVMDF